MAISGEVKSLTEDIEASYETRVAAVSDLAEETHQILGNFKRERERMAGDLKRSLASNRSDRIRQVQKMRAGNSRDFEGVTQTVAEFLAAAEKERMQAFTPLMEEIRSLVTRIENDTARTLAAFRSEHKEMAEVLRRELAVFRSERKEMTEALRSELTDFRRDLRKEVSDMLAEFSIDHRQAHADWENMTRAMTAKRASKQASSAEAKKGVPVSV